MGRAQFEYDEIGNTFYYVIVSFYTLVLIPLTYFLWPSSYKKVGSIQKAQCHCDGDLLKRSRKAAVKPWERTKRILKALVLSLSWLGFIFLLCKIFYIEHDYTEYDPYKILQLDLDADASEIKKKYRELSKTHHPDKGGKAETFDEIVKAYKALTDDEARENWRLYGNPDGPRATTFGIALPKWIVSEKYGSWVLGIYVLTFMIVLPSVVGFWWYNSMKYSADKVLLETTRLYYFFLQKTPSMEINRIIMVLAGSFEFWKRFNVSIIERETDDVEVPRVMKELRNLGENKKENPLCHPWSLKARTLIHAYLSRIDLRSERLDTDQNYIVGKLLLLLEEFSRVLLQMIFQIHMQRPPTIETLENTIRLFPMFVQALWPKNSNLLQIPHIYEHNIAYLRKNRVITCQDLAQLSETRRKNLLNTVTPDQYDDIVFVLSLMPRLEIETKIEVQGEEDKETVTVGSVVTVKVTLKRFPLLDSQKRLLEVNDVILVKPDEPDNVEPFVQIDEMQHSKRKIWEKQPKKKTKKGKFSQKTVGKKFVKVSVNQAKENIVDPSTSKSLLPSVSISDNEDSDPANDSDTASETDESTKSKKESNDDSNLMGENDGDEELDWNDADLLKKETLLDSEPTDHHEVHCPYFPGDKYEWWYLYMIDRKSHRLITPVICCKTLKNEKTVELRFPAPSTKGIYYFTLHVRSDSYMDFDYSSDLKMEVHPAREPVQVKYEEEEEGEEENDTVSSEYTEGSDTDEES